MIQRIKLHKRFVSLIDTKIQTFNAECSKRFLIIRLGDISTEMITGIRGRGLLDKVSRAKGKNAFRIIYFSKAMTPCFTGAATTTLKKK